MASKRPPSFTVPQSAEDEAAYGPLVVRLAEPALVADGLYLQTWASSEVLARQLHRIGIVIPETVRSGADTSTVGVLEIGAGTGLVGLVGARVWKAPVVLTDLAPIVPGIAQNIELNPDLASREKGGAPVQCGTLDWAKPTALGLGVGGGDGGDDDASATTPEPDYCAANKAHVVIASDTIYSEDHPEMLANVIVQWLSREDPGARAILGYAMRVSYLDYIRDMWQRLEAAGMEAVEEGRDNADNEVFDDECLIEWSVWRWKRAG